MPQVVAVGFHRAEGDAPQAVEFEDVGDPCGGGGDVDVGFFADADLVAEGEERGVFEVRVEGEVVEPAVGEAVAVVCGGREELMAVW